MICPRYVNVPLFPRPVPQSADTSGILERIKWQRRVNRNGTVTSPRLPLYRGCLPLRRMFPFRQIYIPCHSNALWYGAICRVALNKNRAKLEIIFGVGKLRSLLLLLQSRTLRARGHGREMLPVGARTPEKAMVGMTYGILLPSYVFLLPSETEKRNCIRGGKRHVSRGSNHRPRQGATDR